VNLRLALLSHGAPKSVKMRLLDELARATSAGFDCERPSWTGRSYEARLEEYARFTADQAGRVLETGNADAVEAVKRRLRSESADLGARMRRGLRLTRCADVMDALSALYGHIGIDMRPLTAGDIVVGRCLFARYFTEPVCMVVAAIDQGMAAGLSGGGRLEFVERITGGAPCCRARFDLVRWAR
jgi:hypothetical protein